MAKGRSCFKIVCVGRNYLKHIEELGNRRPSEPVFFLKPCSAVANRLQIPKGERCDFEGELSFRIVDGRLGEVGFGLDLTLRDLQRQLKEKGLPWDRAKGFKGSALFSKFAPISDWRGLEVRTYIDGELRQRGGVGLMLFKPDQLLKEADRAFGLEEGDLLMTGTPAGVGRLRVGNRVRGEVWQMGRLLVEREWVVEERG
ncbi:MAG: fumarylacetoacetate hydrolase family protein [Campylobacterales bacterium]